METVYNAKNYITYGVRLQYIYNGKCSLNYSGATLILSKFVISVACGNP